MAGANVTTWLAPTDASALTDSLSALTANTALVCPQTSSSWPENIDSSSIEATQNNPLMHNVKLT